MTHADMCVETIGFMNGAARINEGVGGFSLNNGNLDYFFRLESLSAGVPYVA